VRLEPYIRSLPRIHRIALVAEDPLVRSGLLSLLGAEADFAVASEQSLQGPGADPLDLRLWDVGSRPAQHLAELAEIPTLALVSDEDTALEVLRAGAQGVLLRNAPGERLVAGLRALSQGLGVFEPALLRALLNTRALPVDIVSLTPREAEVLGLVAEGLSNKLIADRLKISEHTVKFHVNSILNKLSAETRTEAVVLAARRGLLML
jgi:two-component system, NarL family, nitrate/nitrite response regulator NarL